MEIRVSMKVKPWIAPNFVQCEVGNKETAIPISDAPPESVQALADQWLRDVYEKAGLTPNWRFE